MGNPVSKEILFEYFAGRATPLHQKMVEEGLGQPENEYYFYQCLHEWESTFPQYRPDLDTSLSAYENFISHTPSRPVPVVEPVRSVFSLFNLRGLAATVVLLILAGITWWVGRDYWLYQTYTTQGGETKNLILADNSQVTLSANSSLKVPRSLVGEKREVWLRGEAFFSVHKMPDRQPFTVHTQNLQVQVLGTKFNVTNRHQSTQVVLQEGKVQVIPNHQPTQSVLMQPGDYTELSANATQLRKKKVKVENFTAWRENRFIFESTPLPKVLQKVEDYYGISIRLKNNSLAGKQYTGILPTNDLEVILKSLSSIYGLRVIRKDQQIILQ